MSEETKKRQCQDISYLGAHVSISGGICNAIATARSLHCDTFQIFTKSQLQWDAPPIPDSDAAAFRAGVREHQLHASAHAAYLINLASPNDTTWQRSIAALIDELRRAYQLGIPFVVVHAGSSMDQDAQWGLDRITEAVSQVLQATHDIPTAIALETGAGQGRTLCNRFEDMGALLSRLTSERMGVCFDSAHVFAAGYPIHTEQGYLESWNEFEGQIPLDALRIVHLNDSIYPCGCKNDRHTHIGKGKIGAGFFRRLLADPRFHTVPKVIETPKGPGAHSLDWDRQNLRRLRAYYRLECKARAGTRH